LAYSAIKFYIGLRCRDAIALRCNSYKQFELYRPNALSRDFKTSDIGYCSKAVHAVAGSLLQIVDAAMLKALAPHAVGLYVFSEHLTVTLTTNAMKQSS